MAENVFQGYAPQGQLAQIMAARRQQRQQETFARVQNEELETVLSEGGDSIDINRAMAEAQLRAARRIGQLGNHQAAAQLYRQGAELINASGMRDAELGKLYSETTENLASAEASGQPKDEFVRLQNEREALMARYQNVDATTAAGKAIQTRIDELSQRLNYMSTHVGRTEFDPDATKPTTAVQTDIQRALFNVGERISRLQEMQANFRPELLSVLQKAKTGVAYLADKLDMANPQDKAAVTTWVDFSQSAANDMNAVIRELAGAAVTTGEAERQLRVLINPGSLGNPFSGDSPEEAQIKLANNLKWAQAAQARYVDLLQRGLIPKDKPIDETLAARFPIESYIPREAAAPAPMDFSKMTDEQLRTLAGGK